MPQDSEQLPLPEWRSPIYNKFGTVDMEIAHSTLGWIPFTADPDDPEAHGRALYAAALEAGGIAAYVLPTTEETRAIMPSLSRKQFRLGMREIGITSQMIVAAIDAIPEDQREVATIEWEDSVSYTRLHPLVVQLSAAFNKTSEEIDAAWVAALSYE